jgi:TonB family protein
MLHNLFKLIALAFFTCLFGLNCIAQVKRDRLAELFANLKEDEKLVAECEQKAREAQIAKFGRVQPKISGHCWDGCPTSIALPYYSREARQLGISGLVKIETIVDERGNVVYARVVKGLPFLSQAAEKAAYRSRYAPKKTCGDKPVKFRWMITYNFILNRWALK